MMRRILECSFLIIATAGLPPGFMNMAMAGQSGAVAPSTSAELARKVDQLASAPVSLTPAQLTKDLDQIATTASVMVDGDTCRKIGTSPYHLDQESFTRVKKTLIRLSRLVSFPCDVNLWMPVPDNPDLVQAVIRNENDLSQFWVFGVKPQKMFPQMEQVLKTGQRLTVDQRRHGMVSVLAPVYDSMGDIVGLVEVASKETFDCRCDPGK